MRTMTITLDKVPTLAQSQQVHRARQTRYVRPDVDDAQLAFDAAWHAYRAAFSFTMPTRARADAVYARYLLAAFIVNTEA